MHSAGLGTYAANDDTSTSRAIMVKPRPPGRHQLLLLAPPREIKTGVAVVPLVLP
jgi:hypothetical protein